MLDRLLSPKLLGDNYLQFNTYVNSGIRTNVSNIPTPVKFALTGFLSVPILYVVHNKVEGDEAVKNLSLYFDNVECLLPKPELLISASKFSNELLGERLNTINKMATNCPKVVVATIEGLMGLFPNKELLKKRIFSLKINDEISLEELSNKLTLLGYCRRDCITNYGMYTIKGDIVDVSLLGGKTIRLNFFGDTLERIKLVDIESMKSTEELDMVTFYSVVDVLFEESEREEILNKIDNNLIYIKDREQNERVDRLKEQLVREIVEGYSSNLTELLPFTKYSTVFDYLPKDTTIIFSEFARIADTAKSISQEHQSRYKLLIEKGDILKSQIEQLISFDKVIGKSREYNSASLNTLLVSDKGYSPMANVAIKATAIMPYPNGNEEIVRDINNWLKSNYKVILCGKDRQSAKRLSELLSNDGALVSYKDDPNEEIAGAVVIPIEQSHGFILHDKKIVVIGTYDIMKKGTKQVISKSKKKTDPFLKVEIGDVVVHEIHGIGRLLSVSTVKTGDVIHDYAIVEYRGGDKLYVPAEQMDCLVKFSGSEKIPPLSKIGGKEFENIKERVKASIKEMAINLKGLYAERENKIGYQYGDDTEFQREFEQAFPYTDTADQKIATSEIKKDMTDGKIMDRLLVGDVGYGKTEVAFRAIFKAIENGKQACLLCPTTILSYQHYKTAVERFKGFGIRIDYLNRFKKDKEIEQTLIDLKEGKIDLIISTHRVLSKDVQFYDLGLLVLDEEQRFGVEDKEKIKDMKKDVDVLSMSATPIPRTLNMSLVGIRDISTIETPPSERIPPQVIVTEQTEGILKDGILKELSRGGQVFILYNRVKDIYSFANKIQEIVPEAKIIVAHGQMNTNVLEQNIEKFVLGEYDILVTTTIIENGIDIPRANTMIVIDADKFGLSTAYQLKGRVGRSDKLAFVYFTFKENKVLSENAYKRLEAIREFTEFGSGFKIAMRDLEIRGSGNILGREQHGHMEKVGYDMYCKLLKRARNEIEGIEEDDYSTEMDVQLTAYIPESFVANSSSRIELYTKISTISSMEEYNLFNSELEDIYGVIPREVTSLIKLSFIKNVLSKNRVIKLVANNKVCEMELNLNTLKNGKILTEIEKNNKFSLEFKDKILLKLKEKSVEKGVDTLFNMASNIL